MKTVLGTVIGEPQILSQPGYEKSMVNLATLTPEACSDVWLCVGERSLIAQIRIPRVGSRLKATGRWVPAIDPQGRVSTRKSDDAIEVPIYCFELTAIELAQD